METVISESAQPGTNLVPKGYRKQTWWKTGLNLIRRKPLGAVGGIILIALITVAIFAPQLATKDRLRMDSTRMLAAPQDGNLGTDEFGRDLLSRLIWGARISLFVGLMAVGLGTTSGAVLGLVGGYYGGRVDFVIQRAM
ncbi:partial putative D,D-dipeptide transport system permease protein DdpC, partial [Anaerolineae bacterium]